MAIVERHERSRSRAPVAGAEREHLFPVRRRFSVAEYYRMAEAGILRRGERTELIQGEVIVMSPIGPPHASCVDRLNHLLGNALGERAWIRVQGPLRLDDDTEPEPDLLVLRPKPDAYRSGHPGPTDVLLLVEVMDSSAGKDRDVKLGIYARAGVSEVWLVDLNRELIEAYRRPIDAVYTENRVLPRGQSLAPEAFPGAALGVDAVLG